MLEAINKNYVNKSKKSKEEIKDLNLALEGGSLRPWGMKYEVQATIK